jgi:hypothetical protein
MDASMIQTSQPASQPPTFGNIYTHLIGLICTPLWMMDAPAGHVNPKKCWSQQNQPGAKTCKSPWLVLGLISVVRVMLDFDLPGEKSRAPSEIQTLDILINSRGILSNIALHNDVCAEAPTI